MTIATELIANAIRDTDPSIRWASQAAKAAAEALTDNAIVANAVEALIKDGWDEKIGDDTDLRQNVNDLIRIARVVLGSVAGE